MPRVIAEFEEHRLVRSRKQGFESCVMLHLEKSLGEDAMGHKAWGRILSTPADLKRSGKDGGNEQARFVRWLSSVVPFTTEDDFTPVATRES